MFIILLSVLFILMFLINFCAQAASVYRVHLLAAEAAEEAHQHANSFKHHLRQVQGMQGEAAHGEQFGADALPGRRFSGLHFASVTCSLLPGFSHIPLVRMFYSKEVTGRREAKVDGGGTPPGW